MADDLPTL